MSSFWLGLIKPYDDTSSLNPGELFDGSVNIRLLFILMLDIIYLLSLLLLLLRLRLLLLLILLLILVKFIGLKYVSSNL